MQKWPKIEPGAKYIMAEQSDAPESRVMPRRYQPAQLAAAVIIGIAVALFILIFYHRIWL